MYVGLAPALAGARHARASLIRKLEVLKTLTQRTFSPREGHARGRTERGDRRDGRAPGLAPAPYPGRRRRPSAGSLDAASADAHGARGAGHDRRPAAAGAR